MHLIPYLRVSQDDQNLTAGGQLESVRQWAEAHGHTLAAPQVDDGLSGTLGPERRPGLSAGLAACSGPGRTADGLVAANTSRFCRDLALCGHLQWVAKAGGFCLVTADGWDSRDQSTSAKLLGAVDSWKNDAYVADVKAATRRALQAMKGRGEVYGKVPFGYRREGNRLIEVPADMATLARMFELAAVDPSPTAVAHALNREGLTNRGKPWVRPTVAHLLKNRQAGRP